MNPDDLSPEDRALWDKSYIGQVTALQHTWREVKRAIYDALPKWLSRFLERP